MKIDGRITSGFAQDWTVCVCVCVSGHEPAMYMQTRTHAHTHMRGHRCNYLSNASCDFLEVNELINIRNEGCEEGWGEGGHWLEVGIFNPAPAVLFY